MSERRCGFCARSIAHMRADAMWCCDGHRKAARRAASADKARTRRARRNGRGVRVYLAPEDFTEDGELRVHDLGVTRKLDRAFERILERSRVRGEA